MCSTKICCNKCNVFKKAQYLYVPKLTYLIRIKLQNLQLAGIIILINQSVYTLHVHTCSQKPLPYQLHHFHYADVIFNSIWCYCNLQDSHHESINLHHQHQDQPMAYVILGLVRSRLRWFGHPIYDFYKIST